MGQRKLSSLLLWIVTLTPAAASAQTLGQREVILSFGSDKQVISLVSAAKAGSSSSEVIDYATFVYSLIAFVTKEILPDSHDEYPESPLGSRLSRDGSERNSAFGKQCLAIVSQVGATLPSFSSLSPDFTTGPLSRLDDLLRVTSRALAVHQIWSAFKNDVEDDKRGFSLNPKVGAQRVGVTLTFHW